MMDRQASQTNGTTRARMSARGFPKRGDVMNRRLLAESLLALALLGALVACPTQTTPSTCPDGTVCFKNLSSDAPAGQLQNFKPAVNGVGYASNNQVLSVALENPDFGVNTPPAGAQTFAIAIKGIAAPKAGDTIALSQVPTVSGIEYNYYTGSSIVLWVVTTGTLTIDSVNGAQIAYHLTANMGPGTSGLSGKGTFTLQFSGTGIYGAN